MKQNLCFRCGNEIVHARGYGAIHFGQGSVAVDQLRSWRRYPLCEGCIEPLQAWLGLEPPSQIPAPTEDPAPEPSEPVVLKRPVGCNSAYA